MSSDETLRARLTRGLAKTKMSQGRLARQSGVAQPHISALIAGKRGASPETWTKLLAVVEDDATLGLCHTCGGPGGARHVCGPPTPVQEVAVRLGRHVVICPRDPVTGIVEVPLGIGVDVELTGLFTTILRECGVSETETAHAMNKLRVRYVMGPQASVADTEAYLDSVERR